MAERWKWLLLALCALASVVIFADAADQFGLGGRPWYGWWDANVRMTGRPYVVAVTSARSDGVSARAGLRDGDWVDIRELPLDARVAQIEQLMATRPTALVVHRGSRIFRTSVVGSTTVEGVPLVKVPAKGLALLAAMWFLGCAILIALRTSSTREGRILALALLCFIATLFRPGNMVLPSAPATLLFQIIYAGCSFTAALLLILLASSYGVRHAWRRPLEWFAYLANALVFLAGVLGTIGLYTLWYDPLPYLSPPVLVFGAYAVFWDLLVPVAGVALAVVAWAAVASTPESERPRAAWLLLPLPIALATVGIANVALGLATSWFAYSGIVAFYNLVWLISGLAVTYALLKRRVLDLEFVLSRTLVVATVSLIVVVAFVLLEWVLGTVLAGVSHATGLIANAGLALVLGISLRYIHNYVDAFVDRVLFRKRHEDERALRDFSQEASFVTEPGALLDQTIERIKRHTDARDASVLLDGVGHYSAVRSFGKEMPREIGENDGVILALKAWHKPLDPHHYATDLRGALALPMFGRGHLLGIVLLGERAGGESYAPDEIEALSQLARGVGSALDALSVESSDGTTRTKDSMILSAILSRLDEINDRLGAPQAG